MVTVVEMAELEGAEGLGVEDTSGNVDGGIADCAHDKEGRERRVRTTGTTERYIGFVVRVLRGTPSYLSSRAAGKGVGKHNQISPEAFAVYSFRLSILRITSSMLMNSCISS